MSSPMKVPQASARASERHIALGYEARLSIEGAGPPLVYVPGMDGTGKLFYRQIPGLAGRFRVGTYALRDDAPDMHTLVADLISVLVEVGRNQPAVLVGESFGGALAMSAALERPDMVRALVLLNTFPFFGPQYRLRLAIAAIRVMPWGAMRIVRRVTAYRLHSPHTHLEERRQFLHLTAGTTRRGYLGRLGILTRYDVRERLRELRMPTLLLAADRDYLIPSVEQAKLMAAHIPNATTMVLNGYGHSCFLARSFDLDAILKDWLPASAPPRHSNAY